MWLPSKDFSDWKGCLWCVRYRGRGGCEAYPRGIPLPIVSGAADHLVERPGDNGILYVEADTVREVITGSSAEEV
jgi:hypothetical protein